MGSSREEGPLVDRAHRDEVLCLPAGQREDHSQVRLSNLPGNAMVGWRAARLQPAVASKLMDLRQNRASCRFVLFGYDPLKYIYLRT